jgi:lysozyme
MDQYKLIRTLEKDECRFGVAELKPYRDSKGILTIGVGHNLEEGITKDAAYFILQNDLDSVTADLDANLPWWRALGDVRQRVIANMCFNMGIARLKGFTKMLAAIQRGDFETAADEMLDSKWKLDVGSRAVRLSNEMRTGVDSATE